MELSSADQIEQEFADELQNMSLQEKEAAPSKPSLARGFSEIDPHNEAAARGTSAQKQGSFSARQLPDEPSYRVALQSRYGAVAPPLARTFTERDPSSPISPAPKLAPKPPARTFTEPERPFPPTEPQIRRRSSRPRATLLRSRRPRRRPQLRNRRRRRRPPRRSSRRASALNNA